MFKAGRDAMPPLKEGEIDMPPFGIEKNRRGLELVIQYAFEQGVQRIRLK